MAKRFAVMEFTLRSGGRWRRVRRRLLGHAPVECALGSGIVRETNARKLRCTPDCAVHSQKTPKRPDYW
jgi:hypothetical protein